MKVNCCQHCESDLIGENNGYIHINSPDGKDSVCVEIKIYYCFVCGSRNVLEVY